MQNMWKCFRLFCKKQWQLYCEKKRQEQEEKEWQENRATTIELLNQWLIYLCKQKDFKVYRGENPDVQEYGRKFYTLLNPDMNPREVEKDYEFLTQNCWKDFLSMTELDLSAYQEEIRELETTYADMCRQFQENEIYINDLQNALKIEVDRRSQTYYRQQIRRLESENRTLFLRAERLRKQHSQLLETCLRVKRIWTFVQQGRKPARGYYNNQPDRKLFILSLK